MKMDINLGNLSNTSYKTSIYGNFYGVDFSVDPSLVDKKRSPYALNLISDIGGMPEKRLGWRIIHSKVGSVHGIWYGEINGVKRFIAHIGTFLYIFDSTTITQIYSGISDSASNGFFMRSYEDKGKFFISTTSDFLVYDGTNVVDATTDAYVPTVIISRSPTGGGEVYEGINLLTGKQKNSFLGDTTNTTFQLTATELDSIDKVEVMNSNGDFVEYTETTGTPSATQYKKNLTNGTITFNAAKTPIVTGRDNVIVTFTKTVEGYADRIKKCTINTLYGVGGSNRLFLSGNPEYQAYQWYSDIFNPTYFPDTNYAIVGTADTAIMGYHKLGQYLIILKEDNQQDTTIFQMNGKTDIDGNVTFPIEQGVSGIGAVSKTGFGTLGDEPLFLSRQGVYSITSNTITAERTIKNRSFFIDNQLTKEEDLDKAICCEWNNFFLVGINDKVYVLDGRNKSSKERTSLTNDYYYESYYWDNVPAKCFLSVNGELYFGTNDGKICKFNTDISGVSKYNDNNEAITSIWSTKNDDDSAPHLYKALAKKGSLVTIKPFSRSSADIYIVKDGGEQKKIRDGIVDIFSFDAVDFDRFTFDTDDSPRDIVLRKRINKYKRLQFIVKNDKKDEGFGIFQIVKTYSVKNYVNK